MEMKNFPIVAFSSNDIHILYVFWKIHSSVITLRNTSQVNFEILICSTASIDCSLSRVESELLFFFFQTMINLDLLICEILSWDTSSFGVATGKFLVH